MARSVVRNTMHAHESAQPAGSIWAGARRFGLTGLALLTLLLAFANLWQDWYADPYFAAAVQSMLSGWHNFFFVSFDRAGFVSVDKPPLALWLQAGVAKLLGFRTFSLLLPAALAGIASVALLYHLVRRAFSPTAGALAALFLALTPVDVAVNRSNNMDALVALCTLSGAWAISVAAESGRLRPLLLCALALGLGFNAKFLQTWVVIPTFVAVYLLAPTLAVRARLLRLAPAALVLLVISFWWVVAVDLSPAGQRPYIGSSSNNSELELALGYNGLGRIAGGSTVASAYTGQIGSGAGDPGPFRLFDEQLGGQIGWLLPLALCGLVAADVEAWAEPVAPARVRGRRRAEIRRRPFLEGRQRLGLAVWGGWLLSLWLVYSVSSYFHPYNLAMLAAPICALAGIGITSLWRMYVAGNRWPLPIALLVTAPAQAGIALESPDWNRWLVILSLILVLVAAVWLGIGGSEKRARGRPYMRAVIALGVLALLILPAAWSSVPLWHYGDPEFPIAGPDLLDPSLGEPGTTLAFFAPPSLTRYLQVRQHGERYILAARYGGVAAPVMLATSRAVLDYGGYLGTDNILSNPQLAGLVRDGAVRFFWLLPAPAGVQDRTSIEGWVRSRCSPVPSRVWQPPKLYGAAGPQIYDCYAVRAQAR